LEREEREHSEISLYTRTRRKKGEMTYNATAQFLMGLSVSITQLHTGQVLRDFGLP
jgi:hypothetical protein